LGTLGLQNLGLGGGKFGNGSSQLGSLVETPQTINVNNLEMLFGTLKPLKTSACCTLPEHLQMWYGIFNMNDNSWNFGEPHLNL